MAGIHRIVHQVLVMQGFLKILINMVEVDIEDLSDVIQLATNAAG